LIDIFRQDIAAEDKEEDETDHPLLEQKNYDSFFYIKLKLRCLEFVLILFSH
jgi:hypothetical protein